LLEDAGGGGPETGAGGAGGCVAGGGVAGSLTRDGLVGILKHDGAAYGHRKESGTAGKQSAVMILEQNCKEDGAEGKQAAAVDAAVRVTTGSKSPMSVARLHRRTATRKKDQASVRRPLCLPSDVEFDAWAEEMMVHDAHDQLVDTRFRDMMEV
jgi:hypothetical protein